MNHSRWWHHAVGYSVYLRSFADSNGDGTGDLPGLLSRLDYLESLGIDLLWLTPFYPSPMVDGGYDVADFCDVDPRFGDVGSLDALMRAARPRGIRVIIDLVGNHTSVRHRWFRAAQADRQDPHRAYYIWADPGPDGGPPNNWVSFFGGPAWTLDAPSGQYYLHLFLSDQPDLNWRNPAVRAEFDEIIRFWLDRGVDGFRVDAAQCFVKDAALRSNPQVHHWDPRAPREAQWDAFEHRHDIAQPESLEIFHDWHNICRGYGAVLIGETNVPDPVRFAGLLAGRGLDVGFWFEPLRAGWDAEQLGRALRAPIAQLSDPRVIGWASSSFDDTRAATRLGGGDLGRHRALTLSTLLFCLPGVPFIYQGEELGLEQAVVPPRRRSDPVGATVQQSRDGCRTPMPWEPGPNFGFSSAVATWLPVDGCNDADTVKAQHGTPGSWLERYRALIRLRRRFGELRDHHLEWFEPSPPDLIGFRRGRLTVLANLGHTAIALDELRPALGGIVVFDTRGGGGMIDEPALLRARHQFLQPAQALVLEDPAVSHIAVSS